MLHREVAGTQNVDEQNDEQGGSILLIDSRVGLENADGDTEEEKFDEPPIEETIPTARVNKQEGNVVQERRSEHLHMIKDQPTADIDIDESSD